MKKLLVLDAKNYSEDMEELYRVSVRGIIFLDQKLLLIKNDFGEVKLPGGRMEPGENDYEALAREVKEETGFDIILPSVMPFGEIEEKRLSTREPMIWHQINKLYFCRIYPTQGECNYTESEKKHGFHPILASLEDAIKTNEAMLCKEGISAWNQREYRTLLLIREYLKSHPNCFDCQPFPEES